MSDFPTARWYVAELTEEVIEGSPRNVVHRKTRVIFADSPEDAYEKALSIISETEHAYLNQNGSHGCTRFWGLKELDLMSEGQESGTPPVRKRPHYRATDRLTPAQVAMLMSFVPSGVVN